MSGAKTKALPTSLPPPRERKIGCPLGHSPPRICSKTASSAVATSRALYGGSADPEPTASRASSSRPTASTPVCCSREIVV